MNFSSKKRPQMLTLTDIFINQEITIFLEFEIFVGPPTLKVLNALV